MWASTKEQVVIGLERGNAGRYSVCYRGKGLPQETIESLLQNRSDEFGGIDLYIDQTIHSDDVLNNTAISCCFTIRHNRMFGKWETRSAVFALRGAADVWKPVEETHRLEIFYPRTNCSARAIFYKAFPDGISPQLDYFAVVLGYRENFVGLRHELPLLQ